jgi:4-hydroxy-tetrahydrodipicolinate synthase
MYDLYRSGDTAGAMLWQYRILELFDVMLYQFEFPDGFRAAAELRGFHFGQGRQPKTSAQRSENAALSSVMQCILADFELVNPPAAGCPIPAGAPSKLRLGGPASPVIGPENIQQMVAQVFDEMKNRGIL